MKKHLLRALLALTLCLALTCPALAETAEAIVIEPEAAAEPAPEGPVALEFDEGIDPVIEEIPGLSANLTLEGGLASAEPEAVEPEAVEIAAVEANEDTSGKVPLTVAYSGPTLYKPYDCSASIYRKKDEETYVYAITAPESAYFTIAPAPGYTWLEGHADVQINVRSIKRNADGTTYNFAGADAGSYTLKITFGLSGEDKDLYYCQPVLLPAEIRPPEIAITPPPSMGKIFNDEPFRDPVFKQGTLLFKNVTDETSPYYVDISGVPGYGVPVFTEDDLENLKYLAQEALLKDREMFPGWLGREPGEDVGRYRITLGDMDFGPNFTISLGEEYFTITARSLTDATITVDDIPDQVYTGKALRPVPNLEYEGETLVAGKDFTLDYANNRKPGKATVIVTGKGNYTGRLKLNFTIAPRPTAISRLTAGRAQVTVSWKKVGGVTGYQIAYSQKASFSGQVKKSVKGAYKTAAVVKGLRSRKTYYFRIRTYKTLNGKNHYSAWSKARTVKVK